MPLRCQTQRIPDVLPVDDFGGRGADDAEQAQQNGDEGQEETLPVDTLRSLEVPCEVWDVRGHGAAAIVSYSG